MPSGGALRWLRALTLAAVTLGSGVMGHVASGGHAPSSWLLLAMAVVFTVVFAPALDTPATTPRVAAMSALGQASLHLVLAGVVGESFEKASHGMAGTAAGHSAWAQLPATGLAQMPGSTASVGGVHLGMVLAHALAATIVAVWLAAGERAVCQAMLLAVRPVRRVWRRLRDLAAGSTPPRRRCRPTRRGYSGGIPSLSWTGRRVSPRGPPRWLVA